MLRLKILAEVTPGPHSCNRCLRSYARHNNRQIFCGKCANVVDCSNCNLEFIVKESRKEYTVRYCSNKCRLKGLHKSMHGPVECANHGYQNTSFSGKCFMCLYDAKAVPIECVVHGYQKVSLNGTCNICNGNKALGVKFCSECNQERFHSGDRCFFCDPWEPNKQKIMTCNNCSKNVIHNGYRCFNCDPWDLSSQFLPNWSDLESECNIHPDEVFSCITSGNTYKCWSCMKKSIAEFNNEFNIPGSFMQATYRQSESNISGQFMMEQELVEKEVGWFAYIKFYARSDGSIAPLVAGKSGSKIVNNSGSDISFRYDGDNIARTYLREENLKWDISKVLIIPSESEELALMTEQEIAEQYNLLYS